MDPFLNLNLAGVTAHILIDGRQETGNYWAWDLDPYQVEIESLPDLTVRFSFDDDSVYLSQASANEQLQSLVRSIQGFDYHHILSNSDGDIIWEYGKERNKLPILAYRISKDWKQVHLFHDQSHSAGFLPYIYLGKIIPFCLLPYGVLTLHGVLLEYEGAGIIISANSGVGKTTHARLWRNHKQAIIINGDKAYLKKEQGAWYGYGLPWSGTSGEHVNRRIPIKAVVVIEQSQSNEAAVLKGLEVFNALIPHVQCPSWDKGLSEKAIDLMVSLIDEIPVYHLKCRPDADAVETLYKKIFP